MKGYLCSMATSALKRGLEMMSRLRFSVTNLTAAQAMSLFGLIVLAEIALLLPRFITCLWNTGKR